MTEEPAPWLRPVDLAANCILRFDSDFAQI
jgi:hypothetical protein